MKTPQPRIINQHDYISLVLGQRRLTVSWRGTSAPVGVPADVLKLWDMAMFDSKPEALAKLGYAAGEKPSMLEKVQRFADRIWEIWPQWSTPLPVFTAGTYIKVNFGKRKGTHTCTVLHDDGGNYVTIDATAAGDGRLKVHKDMVEGIA